MDWRKRLLALLMSFAMVLTYMPTIAFAEGGAPEEGDTPAVEEVQDVQAQNDGAAQGVSSGSSEQEGAAEAGDADEPAAVNDTAGNSNEAAELEQEEVVPEEKQPEVAVKKQTAPQSTKSVTEDKLWWIDEENTQTDYFYGYADDTVDLTVSLGTNLGDKEITLVADWYAGSKGIISQDTPVYSETKHSTTDDLSGFSFTAPTANYEGEVYGENYDVYQCVIRQIDEEGVTVDSAVFDINLILGEISEDGSWWLSKAQGDYYPKRTDLTVDLNVEIGLKNTEQERYFVVDWYEQHYEQGEEQESLIKAGDPNDPYVVTGTDTYGFTYTAPLFSDMDDPKYGVNHFSGYRVEIKRVDENGEYIDSHELDIYLHWDVDNREIEYISYEPANGPLELVEGVDGYYTDDTEDGTKYFVYDFDEFMFEGDQLTIKYAGEDEPWTYTYHDDGEEPVFRRQVGDEWDYIYMSEAFELESTQTGPWEVGEHSFNFYYRDEMTEFPVVIVKNNVKAISFSREGYSSANPIELREGVDGTYWEDDSGRGLYYYYSMKYAVGDCLTVTREINGEDVDTKYYLNPNDSDAGYGDFEGEDGSEINLNDIRESSNLTYDNQWTVGNEYIMTLEYAGSTCDVNVGIVPSGIESISFSRPGCDEENPIELTSERIRWFVFEEGDILQVKYEGYDDAFTYVGQDAETSSSLALDGEAPAGIPKYIEGMWSGCLAQCDGIEGQPDLSDWEIGGTYNIELLYGGKTCKIPVRLLEDEPQVPHWEIDGDEERTVYYYEGDEEVTLDVDVNYYNYGDEDYPEITYEWRSDSEDESLGSERSLTVPATEATYYCIVSDGDGNSQTVTFNVRPNGGIDDEKPVYAIKFSRGNGMDHYELYENDGTMVFEDEVDGQTVSYQGYEKPEFEDGDTLTVYADENDTEGTVYTYRSEYYVFVNADDEQLNMERLSESSNQSYNNQWEFGGTGYEFIIGYYGVECSVPVTIIRSEYDSIDFVRSDGTTAFDLVENKDGYLTEDSYYDEETQEYVANEYFRYDPSFDEGDRLILKKNGEEDTVYEYRYSNEDDDTWYFVNVNDDEDRIDRDDVRIQDGQSYENQWSAGNTYEGSVVYQGLAAPVTFNILENPIAGIELERVDGISYNIPENCYGYFFYPEGDDSGYYYYMHPKFKAGDQLKVTYRGTEPLTKTYTYHPFTDTGEGGGWYGKFVSNTDPEDVISEMELYYSDDQDDTHWELGGEGYTFTLYYEGATFDIPVNIIPNPVTAIRFSRPGVDTITLKQGIDSYEDDCELGDTFVKYDYYNFRFEAGDVITAVEGDREVNYVLDGDKFVFIREDDPTVWFSPNDWVEIDDDQGVQYDEDDNEYLNAWQPGETYNYTLSFMDHSVDIPVSIEANPITGMRLVRPGFEDNSIELVADKDIRLNDDGDYYIHFEFKAGDELYISVDGYDEPVKYVAMAYDSGYVYELQAEGEVPDALQASYEPWNFDTDYTEVAYEAGDTGTFQLELSGASAEIAYVVVGNPVASIQFVRDGVDGTFNLEEGVDGFWSYFEDGHKSFEYAVRYHQGDKLIVKYADADDPVTYVYPGYNDYFVAENVPEGVPASIHVDAIDQYSEQNSGVVWDPDNDPDHVITFWYSGREYPVDVHLVPTEVDSISFSSVDNFTEDNPAELVENVDGWEDEGAGVFRYNFSFGEGDVLTIHYKNGSTANYVYRLWRGFINEETGEHLDEENLNVDGNIFYDEEWHPEDGLHYITILYRGRETTVPVVVVENNLDSIEFVSGGAHEVVYENEDFGEFDEERGYFVYYNPRFVAGDKIILNFNDGTSEEYTYDPDKSWFMDASGKTLRQDVHLGGDQESALGMGEHEWPITIMGKTAYIPYKIVPPAIVVHVDAKESTCQVRGNIEYWTKDGKYYRDEDCTQELTEDEVFKPLAAHTPGTAVRENVVAATCESEGGYDEVVYCTVCEEELSRTHNTTAALGHDWSDWTVKTAATCTTAGEEQRVCKHDSTHVETRATAALGHDWSDWTVKTAATCTTAGEEQRVCKHDSTHVETRAIEALGHDWGAWTVKTEATCTTAGEEQRVCKHDSTHVETRTTAALGHDWGAWTVKTEATCTAAGEEQRVCKHDSTHVETRTTAALGHDYGTPVYTWNDDLTECTAMVVCQRNVQHSIVKAGTVTETITKEPTQSEKGSKTVTATFTDEHFQTQTKVVEIPALHTHTPGTPVFENVTKKATTSATGVADKVTYCTECGEEISREAGAEIPKAVAPATTTIRNTVANSSKKTNDVIWDKVAGATNYELRWRARGGSWKSTTVGNTVRGVTTGLTIGGLYEIQVRPFKAATATTEKAYGNWSGSVYRYFFTTQKIRLTSKSKGTFTMSWAKDSKATGYQVLYTTNSNGAGAAQNIVPAKASATSITINKFKNGTKFKSGQTIYVQVRELRRVGNITYVGNISCPVAVKIK